MTRECLQNVSIASPFVRFYHMTDSAKLPFFQRGDKSREAERSGLPQLGILCSILLSYGGTRARYRLLSSKLVSSLLSSFLKTGQIFSFISTQHDST